MLQLQGVGWRLSPRMVIRSNKDLLRRGRHVLDFLFDPAQFLLGIQIIVSFIAVLSLKPLLVSAVQAQISKRRGDILRAFDRAANSRLIDVAVGDLFIFERPEHKGIAPAFVANLYRHWVFT